MSRTTNRLVDLPAKPLHLLGTDERERLLEEIVRGLSSAYVELSQVKIQYLWSYGAAYKASASVHVTGRIQEAEIAAAGIKEDELELEGRIESMTTIRDYLATL